MNNKKDESLLKKLIEAIVEHLKTVIFAAAGIILFVIVGVEDLKGFLKLVWNFLKQYVKLPLGVVILIPILAIGLLLLIQWIIRRRCENRKNIFERKVGQFTFGSLLKLLESFTTNDNRTLMHNFQKHYNKLLVGVSSDAEREMERFLANVLCIELIRFGLVEKSFDDGKNETYIVSKIGKKFWDIYVDYYNSHHIYTKQ